MNGERVGTATASRGLPARVILLGAWWTALALAAAHLLVLAFRRHLLGHVVWQSRDVVWMAPLGYLLLLTVAALPVLGLALAAPHLVTRRRWAGMQAALLTFGALLLFPAVHPLASLVVAVGLGARVATVPERFLTSRGWALSGWLIVLGIGSATAAQVLAHRTAVRAERSAPRPPSGAPNVLLLVWDTVRAASLSLYGHARATTPALDRWAAEGVVFDWAFSTAPWTLPSHASMMTGVYAGEQSGDWRTALDAGHRTLAEHFGARGYATGGFVANLNYTQSFSGLDRGFATYDEHRRSLRQVLLSTTFGQIPVLRAFIVASSPARLAAALRRPGLRLPSPYWVNDQKLDGIVSDAFLQWQQGLDGRPFFAFLNYYNAHEYHPPAAFATRFGPGATKELQYDRAIAFLDSEVQRVLDSLRARGVLDRTLVILTSDHGELFGEHGLYEHGKSLYRGELHVPLVMRLPSHIPAGVRVSTPVSLADLARTITAVATPPDAADAALPRFPGFPGESLLRLAGDTGVSARPVIAEISKAINGQPNWPASRGDMISLVRGELQLIRNGDASEELYAYRDTALGATNLLTTAKGSEAAAPMRMTLQEALRARNRRDRGKDPVTPGDGASDRVPDR